MRKRYVASKQLGEDTGSLLCQLPRYCEHLAVQFDPEMHPVATPPVLCWLCGSGFLSWQALYHHTRATHGDYAEYRKDLFWLAQTRGFLPMLPWQRRHMLANLGFFQLLLPVFLHPRERSYRMDRGAEHSDLGEAPRSGLCKLRATKTLARASVPYISGASLTMRALATT